VKDDAMKTFLKWKLLIDGVGEKLHGFLLLLGVGKYVSLKFGKT
jgi:hypothetical protein